MQRNIRSAAASVTHQRGRPGRSIDTCLGPLNSKSCKRRRFPVVADAGGDPEPGSGDDHGTIRSPAGLVRGARFQRAGIEQRDAGAAAVGDQYLPVVGDGAGHARKSRQRREVLAGVVVDHLDAVARGVRNEDAPALCIEGGVIELAALGVWYGDGSDCFQRHDGLTIWTSTAGTISDKPANRSSTSTALRNVSSSIFPYSLKPLHRPASMNGKPSAYSLRVSVVKAPVTAIEIEITTKAANSTG